jgi:tyrosine-protein kinase Etk/Wzc
MEHDNEKPGIVHGSKDDEVGLFDYLVILMKHSRLIVYSTIIIVVAIFLLLLLTSNKYTAKASIIPPQQNMTLSGLLLDTMGGAVLPSSINPSLLGGLAGIMGLKSPGDLYVEILKGNSIFDRIIERFNLRKYYRTWYAFQDPYLDDIRKKLHKRTDINSGKEGIINIEVTDESPQKAAEMANAFTEELGKLLQGLAVKEAAERLIFLEKERVQTSLKLTKAEGDLQAYCEQSNIIRIDSQEKGIIEYIANLRASIDAKEVQLKVMRQHATPFNYDLILVETELKGLKERLLAAESQGPQIPRSGDIMVNTSKIPALGTEYLRLYREVKYYDALQESYSKLVELARLDESRNVAVIQVVDPATPPERKSKPKRLLITVLVGSGTFIFMVFIAFVVEYWQNMVMSDRNAHYLQLLQNYAQQWRHDARRLRLRLKR